MSCKKCICGNCLNRYIQKCPYGECYDDKRAVEQPYCLNRIDNRFWSDANKFMERAHWCRSGMFYPENKCENYVEYKGVVVQECIKANVLRYQDGTLICPLIDNYGCEKCYKEFERKMED